MQNRKSKQSRKTPKNVAVKTLSWFMYGQKVRLLGGEQTRV